MIWCRENQPKSYYHNTCWGMLLSHSLLFPHPPFSQNIIFARACFTYVQYTFLLYCQGTVSDFPIICVFMTHTPTFNYKFFFLYLIQHNINTFLLCNLVGIKKTYFYYVFKLLFILFKINNIQFVINLNTN